MGSTSRFFGLLKWMLLVVTVMVLDHANAQEKEYHTESNKAIKTYEKALVFLNSGYDGEALVSLDETIELDSNFIEAHMLYGQLMIDQKQYELAIPHLEKVIVLDTAQTFPLAYRMLGDANLQLFKLQEAIDYLEKYKTLPDVSDPAKARADKLIELALYRKSLIDNPVPYNPINLGDKINTVGDEHSPTLTVDEQTLYFTRKSLYYSNAGRDFYEEQLFVSHKNGSGHWMKAELLNPDINTGAKVGASSISPDGNYLFFTSCDRKGGLGSCDLYIARKDGEEWKKSRNLGAVINTRSWESQPSFAPDGRTLYFVKRVGPRGSGHKDIYRTKIQDNGKWSKPVAISINTKGNEESPFMHPDGQTFYFSSDGYQGLGGRDLYMVRIDSNGNFGEPQNLGYPINSYRDEVSLSVSPSGKYAYFASGMEGGFGKWDIYKFELPQVVRPVPVNYSKGLVYNVETKAPVGAKFEIYDLESGKLIIESFSDRNTGKFLVTVPTGKSYAVNVSASGYLFYSANFTLDQGDDSTKVSFDIPLSPIKEGVAVVLNNVFYEFNSYELKGMSKVELDKLVVLLSKNPKMHIEIGGHTDNKGSEAYNQKLSENRAKSVYDYLVSQGIPEEMLSYKGYNFAQPIASNDTEEGRAKNRRTEFKITKVDE